MLGSYNQQSSECRLLDADWIMRPDFHPWTYIKWRPFIKIQFILFLSTLLLEDFCRSYIVDNDPFRCLYLRSTRPETIFCLLLRVSSDYAQPITGQVTELTCPVIGRAQPEFTLSKRQRTGHELSHHCACRCCRSAKPMRPSETSELMTERFSI